MIDEPELYLHPQGIEQVRAALRALAQTGYQIVFSTHSPLLIHQDEIANTIVVRKNEAEGTNTLKPLRSAIASVVTDGPSQTRTLFEFGNAAQIFFCDNVLIAEGTTERALLPEVFKALKQKTLGQSRIALVGLGGSGNIPKSMKILDAMRLTVKALADLDFAFKVAPMAGILDPADLDIANAKAVFQNLATALGIDIGNDGLPTKQGTLTASEAFAEFAKDTDGKPIVESLHGKLRTRGIWLWKKGAIEHHLGVESKSEATWASYRARLNSEKPEDVIGDIDSINDFLDWLTT
ncbi:MAG: AAA family ATPase [Planctomycetes bacterium]|nr:AAA family ATPase [Planctomycetota bacterium]